MKQLIFMLALFAVVFFAGRHFEKIKQWFKDSNLKAKFKFNNIFIIVVAVTCLLMGLVLGKGPGVLKAIAGSIPDIGFARGHIVKNANLFVLSDFESEDDLKKWTTVGAKIKLADEHATSGKHSAKFIYTGGVESSKIAMEKYLYKDTRLGNWEGYNYLLFDIYSIQPGSERLILKIRDEKENTFQRDITIPSKQAYTVKIYLSEIKASVDISRIRQLNLFRWEPKQDSIYYVDNIRLTSDTGAQAAAVTKDATYADTSRNKAPGVSEAPVNMSAVAPASSDEKKLIYLLQPDLEKWNAQDKDGKSVIRFGAYILDSLKIGRVSYPTTGGVPFAQGELKSADNMRLTDINGTVIPSQAKPTAYWPDGSIKWLLIDLQTNIDSALPKELYVEYGPGVKKEPADSPLRILQDDSTLSLSTGVLNVKMDKKKFDLLGTVRFNEKQVAAGGDMYILHNNKRFLASRDTDPEMTIEVEGPERVSIKRTGWFVSEDGDKYCKYILRIEAFKGKSYLRIYHTFIYTGYPENKFYDRYEGLKLPNNETIQEVGILLSHEIKGKSEYAFGLDQNIVSQPFTKDVSLLQADFDKFAILPETSAGSIKGKKLDGWVDITDEKAGLTASIRYLWQQFPKEFTLNKGSNVLDIKLWPAEAGELNLKTTENALGPDSMARGNAFGLAKTHEMFLYFHEPKMDYALVDGVTRALTNPLHLLPDAKWISATTALGGLREYDPKRFYDAEDTLNGLFDWANRQPKVFNWYGMLNFGDTLSWYRKDAYDKEYDTWGWHPEGRWGWYNCEGVGTHSGALLQCLRTGKLKYFEFGENLTRHIMDVDTCHYNTVKNDPRLRGILDDEVSQPGSMHRHNGDHWGDRNEEADHTNIYGILLYYYLTGYERALDVAKEAGSFFLKEPITYTRHPDQAPQRAIANVLWGEMMLYETTRDETYKSAADKWAKLFVSGQGDEGYWQENYNPMDKRWAGEANSGYMTVYTLPALIQYHIDTKDESVGRAIIKGAEYIMAHEEYKACCDAVAYSYWLTGNDKYRAFLEGYLGKFAGWRNKEDDDLHRGMIFDKVIYHRPNEYMYSVPFAFQVLAYKRSKAIAAVAANAPSVKDAPAPVLAVPSANIDPGINYSTGYASSLYKIFPDAGNMIEKNGSVTVALAKNEYESGQIVLYDANKKLNDVVISASDLKDRKTGEKIGKENVEIRLVEYVKTKEPDYKVERVGFWPDPLSDNKPFSLEPKTMRPLWITVYAPKDAAPGNYTGKLVITPSNAVPREIAINVKVYNFELPDTPSFRTAFDLYSGRMRKVYAKGFQEDDAHYDMRKAEIVGKYYDSMLKFKISPILNLDYPSNTFDSIVKNYVARGMSAFGVGKYGGSFDNSWPKEGSSSIVEYYSGIAKHLRAGGWLDKAYVYTYDEPKFGDPRVAEVAAAIHTADPELKNMVCLMDMMDPKQYKDWVKDIDIFTIRNYGFDYDLAKSYKEMGKELWIYVSGPKPPFPNLAIDFPAMAYRILPWMGWKYQVSGLLYWCVNFYEDDPWKNPMNTKWKQNGNGFLFYPGENGPVPTIRLYVLRDGIEDYEYFHILAQKIKDAESKGPDASGKALIENAKKILTIDNSIVASMADYTKNAALIYKKREEVAEAIEELNKISNGKIAEKNGQLSFELYRGGRIDIDKESGVITQRSDSYRDVAIIRSTDPLPMTYKISAIVGDINYDLSNIKGLEQDSEYKEGPQNENGCYLLAITDEAPTGHHTNDWWHQHRKVCIDVDNNVWGSGMPHPVFFTYYDKNNKMMAFDGETEQWGTKWAKAITYEPEKWYKVAIEKTDRKFILKIYDDKGKLLKGAMVDLKDIWHEDGSHPDYMVMGDPHENYYQGSVKIKSITMPVTTDEKS